MISSGDEISEGQNRCKGQNGEMTGVRNRDVIGDRRQPKPFSVRIHQMMTEKGHQGQKAKSFQVRESEELIRNRRGDEQADGQSRAMEKQP